MLAGDADWRCWRGLGSASERRRVGTWTPAALWRRKRQRTRPLMPKQSPPKRPDREHADCAVRSCMPSTLGSVRPKSTPKKQCWRLRVFHYWLLWPTAGNLRGKQREIFHATARLDDSVRAWGWRGGWSHVGWREWRAGSRGQVIRRPNHDGATASALTFSYSARLRGSEPTVELAVEFSRRLPLHQ